MSKIKCPDCKKEISPHFTHDGTDYSTNKGRSAIYEDWVANCPKCGCRIRFREWFIHEDDEYWGD